jgi:hypothetical protein
MQDLGAKFEKKKKNKERLNVRKGDVRMVFPENTARKQARHPGKLQFVERRIRVTQR